MIPRYRSQTPAGKRKEDREDNVDKFGQDQAAPDRAQAREAGEREGSYRSSTTVAGRAKSKESEEEPSEGKKKKEKKKIRQLTADAKSTSASPYLLYSTLRVDWSTCRWCMVLYLPA